MEEEISIQKELQNEAESPKEIRKNCRREVRHVSEFGNGSVYPDQCDHDGVFPVKVRKCEPCSCSQAWIF